MVVFEEVVEVLLDVVDESDPLEVSTMEVLLVKEELVIKNAQDDKLNTPRNIILANNNLFLFFI